MPGRYDVRRVAELDNGSFQGEANLSCVTGVEGGNVRFGCEGKHTYDIREGIRVSDVRWLMGYLGRISDDQIRDGLRAAGATAEESNCLASALRERITQLKRVAGS
jgi:hypothetical protein